MHMRQSSVSSKDGATRASLQLRETTITGKGRAAPTKLRTPQATPFNRVSTSGTPTPGSFRGTGLSITRQPVSRIAKKKETERDRGSNAPPANAGGAFTPETSSNASEKKTSDEEQTELPATELSSEMQTTPVERSDQLSQTNRKMFGKKSTHESHDFREEIRSAQEEGLRGSRDGRRLREASDIREGAGDIRKSNGADETVDMEGGLSRDHRESIGSRDSRMSRERRESRESRSFRDESRRESTEIPEGRDSRISRDGPRDRRESLESAERRDTADGRMSREKRESLREIEDIDSQVSRDGQISRGTRDSRSSRDGRMSRETRDGRMSREMQDGRMSREMQDGRMSREMQDGRMSREMQECRMSRERQECRMSRERQDGRMSRERQDGRMSRERQGSRDGRSMRESRISKDGMKLPCEMENIPCGPEPCQRIPYVPDRKPEKSPESRIARPKQTFVRAPQKKPPSENEWGMKMREVYKIQTGEYEIETDSGSRIPMVIENKIFEKDIDTLVDPRSVQQELEQQTQRLYSQPNTFSNASTGQIQRFDIPFQDDQEGSHYSLSIDIDIDPLESEEQLRKIQYQTRKSSSPVTMLPEASKYSSIIPKATRQRSSTRGHTPGPDMTLGDKFPDERMKSPFRALIQPGQQQIQKRTVCPSMIETPGGMIESQQEFTLERYTESGPEKTNIESRMTGINRLQPGLAEQIEILKAEVFPVNEPVMNVIKEPPLQPLFGPPGRAPHPSASTCPGAHQRTCGTSPFKSSHGYNLTPCRPMSAASPQNKILSQTMYRNLSPRPRESAGMTKPRTPSPGCMRPASILGQGIMQAQGIVLSGTPTQDIVKESLEMQRLSRMRSVLPNKIDSAVTCYCEPPSPMKQKRPRTSNIPARNGKVVQQGSPINEDQRYGSAPEHESRSRKARLLRSPRTVTKYAESNFSEEPTDVLNDKRNVRPRPEINKISTLESMTIKEFDVGEEYARGPPKRVKMPTEDLFINEIYPPRPLTEEPPVSVMYAAHCSCPPTQKSQVPPLNTMRATRLAGRGSSFPNVNEETTQSGCTPRQNQPVNTTYTAKKELKKASGTNTKPANRATCGIKNCVRFNDSSDLGVDLETVQKMVEEENEDVDTTMHLIDMPSTTSPSTYSVRQKLRSLRKKSRSVKILEESLEQNLPHDDDGAEVDADLVAILMHHEETGNPIRSPPRSKRSYYKIMQSDKLPGEEEEPIVNLDISGLHGCSIDTKAEDVRSDSDKTNSRKLHFRYEMRGGAEQSSGARPTTRCSTRPQSACSGYDSRPERAAAAPPAQLPLIPTRTSPPNSTDPKYDLEAEFPPWRGDGEFDEFREEEPSLVEEEEKTPSESYKEETSVESSVTVDEIDYILEYEPPKHFSRVQLRGSTLPSWFPGYFCSFPDNQALKIEKRPSVVFKNAWNTFKPNDVLENSEIVIV